MIKSDSVQDSFWSFNFTNVNILYYMGHSVHSYYTYYHTYNNTSLTSCCYSNILQYYCPGEKRDRQAPGSPPPAKRQPLVEKNGRATPDSPPPAKRQPLVEKNARVTPDSPPSAKQQTLVKRKEQEVQMLLLCTSPLNNYRLSFA